MNRNWIRRAGGMLLASALFLSLASGCGQGQGAASQAAMLYPRESVELVAHAASGAAQI